MFAISPCYEILSSMLIVVILSGENGFIDKIYKITVTKMQLRVIILLQRILWRHSLFTAFYSDGTAVTVAAMYAVKEFMQHICIVPHRY